MNEDLWDIYQMINNIILQMDEAETPENAELFEKIRWLIQELELKVTRMSNSISIMEECFSKFSDAFTVGMEEVKWKYKKPQENS